MRIVHIIDYFQPLLGYQETYLARVQRRAGHEVYVITSDRYAPSLYPAVENLIGKRVRKTGYFIEEGIPVIRLPVLFEILGRVLLSGLKRMLIDLQPEVIIIHGVLGVATLQVAALRQKLPTTHVIVDDHMVYAASRKTLRFLYSIFRIMFSRWLGNKLDKLVSTQKESTQFMIEQFGFPRDMITFIPHGCDTTLFTKDIAIGKKIRAQLNISDETNVFIYAGKVIPEKGPHLLIQAALNLIEQNLNIHVLVVGNGEQSYINDLKKLITSFGADDHFSFVGMVDNSQLFEYYSASDVGVWPLQCSLTMIEAMSCGLPIIISDESGTPDRVEHGSGYLYRNGSYKDLTTKMILLVDESRRSSMSKKAREFAEQHDWTKISDRFLHFEESK